MIPAWFRSRSARLAASGLLGAALIATSAGTGPATAAASGGYSRQISASGTGGFTSSTYTPPSSAGVQSPETLGGADGDLGPDRSNSGSGGTPVGAIAQPHTVTNSTPGLLGSFQGINHFDQRFGSPNQFSVEPPDQGLCVGQDGSGNTRVMEVVNDTAAVYGTTGNRLAMTALNPFFQYADAIVRSGPTYGPFVTDPSCLYDAMTGRWFVDVLTIDTIASGTHAGHFPGPNHLDIAVSDTQDPLGSWTVYRIPVQDDGTQGTPDHHCSNPNPNPPAYVTNPNACFGDYPHLGSDANGIYLTTNEYSFFGPEFHGAQVYALSKAQLESGGGSVTVTQFDTHGMDNGFALNGFTLWPSNTPGGGGDPGAGGTEYFLSSNAAAEAHDPGDGSGTFHPSTELLVWALTNTSSVNSTPALTLSWNKLAVGRYTMPPAAVQKSGNQPLRDCLNNSSCSQAQFGIKDPWTEKSANLDANDTRMQQVTWVNGHLWGALDTGLTISSAKQAGIEWFDALASTASGSLASSVGNWGYLGLGNDNLTYPAVAITSGGTGVMAFTVAGADYYPSAGYATVTPAGIGAVHIAAAGQGPDDGFTDYRLSNNPPDPARPRWGDYGAAVAMGDNVWIASEYIAQSCSYAEWLKTSFRCGNTRTFFANWATRISEVSAP